MKFNSQISGTEVAKLIIVNFMHCLQIDASKNDPASDAGNVDGVYVYAIDLLSLGLLWHLMIPSRKEIEGEY